MQITGFVYLGDETLLASIHIALILEINLKKCELFIDSTSSFVGGN
jgi:hypothetical protein